MNTSIKPSAGGQYVEVNLSITEANALRTILHAYQLYTSNAGTHHEVASTLEKQIIDKLVTRFA